ncbi:hypothetical protein E2320_012692 [Naja naja]|nr:hypothetical protein E2320_012692 [Naja naja]
MAEAAVREAEARLAACLEETLGSRRGANRVFEILELLQAEDKEIILCAIRTCSRLFGALLTRGELFVGRLPPEEDSVQGNYSAEEKYKIWMRHRYKSCTTCLGELMAHEAFQVKETALCTLMKFVELEAKHPLVKNEWSFNFPRELLQVVVEGLIQMDQNSSL